MKAVNKELIIDANEPAPERAESSDEDDLFDNLRKLRESAALNIPIESAVTRKRSRSIDSDDTNTRQKMQKILEDDENQPISDKDDDDDILSFAKKTLQQDFPDTEDILGDIPRTRSGK